MTLITWQELRDWQDGGFYESVRSRLPIEIDGVRLWQFLDGYQAGTLSFCYKNGSGLIQHSNGYAGEQPGGKNYWPRLKVSPRYSQADCFCPTCEPTLEAAAAAIRASWESFISK